MAQTKKTVRKQATKKQEKPAELETIVEEVAEVGEEVVKEEEEPCTSSEKKVEETRVVGDDGDDDDEGEKKEEAVAETAEPDVSDLELMLVLSEAKKKEQRLASVMKTNRKNNEKIRAMRKELVENKEAVKTLEKKVKELEKLKDATSAPERKASKQRLEISDCVTLANHFTGKDSKGEETRPVINKIIIFRRSTKYLDEFSFRVIKTVLGALDSRNNLRGVLNGSHIAGVVFTKDIEGVTPKTVSRFLREVCHYRCVNKFHEEAESRHRPQYPIPHETPDLALVKLFASFVKTGWYEVSTEDYLYKFDYVEEEKTFTTTRKEKGVVTTMEKTLMTYGIVDERLKVRSNIGREARNPQPYDPANDCLKSSELRGDAKKNYNEDGTMKLVKKGKGKKRKAAEKSGDEPEAKVACE